MECMWPLSYSAMVWKALYFFFFSCAVKTFAPENWLFLFSIHCLPYICLPLLISHSPVSLSFNHWCCCAMWCRCDEHIMFLIVNIMRWCVEFAMRLEYSIFLGVYFFFIFLRRSNVEKKREWEKEKSCMTYKYSKSRLSKHLKVSVLLLLFGPHSVSVCVCICDCHWYISFHPLRFFFRSA